MLLEPRDYLSLIRRHLWMLLLFAAAAGGAAFFFSRMGPETYAAQARLLIIREPISEERSPFPQNHLRNLSNLLTNETMLRIYASRTGFDLTSPEMKSNRCSLTVRNIDGTDIFEFRAQSMEPSFPARMVNALANTIIDCTEPRGGEESRQALARVDPLLAAAAADAHRVKAAVTEYERIHGPLKPPEGPEQAALARAVRREAVEELHVQGVVTNEEYRSLLPPQQMMEEVDPAPGDERIRLLRAGLKADVTYSLLTRVRSELAARQYLATFQAYLLEPASRVTRPRPNAPLNAAAAMAGGLVLGISAVLSWSCFTSSKQARPKSLSD